MKTEWDHGATHYTAEAGDRVVLGESKLELIIDHHGHVIVRSDLGQTIIVRPRAGNEIRVEVDRV